MTNPKLPRAFSFALTVAVSVFLAAPGHSAETLYKWVDAQGNVHFSDRPPEESQQAEELEIDVEISGERQREADERLKASQTALTERQLARIEQNKSRAEMSQQRQREQAQSQIRCAQAKANLAAVDRAAPAYSINSNGEREFLEDADRDKKITQFRRAVKDLCGKG